VEVVLEAGGPGAGTATLLNPEPGGYHSGRVAAARVGSRYRYRLDGKDAFPDPASRFQPEGPHGPSEVIEPDAFRWTDRDWQGVTLRGQVIYEMHIGTFTPEGTWKAAIQELAELARLGVTVLEVMPVAEFPGRFGWGYDGVDFFAPTRLYGSPNDFRRFVDAAHAAGLGVILDVVYNHFGPDGCYLKQFSDSYFSTKHKTEWGEALNYDGPGSAAVREFITTNAAYWIEEYHLDGLRLDATQSIFDDSTDHILAAVGRSARAAAARHGRSIILFAENEPQHTRLVRPVDQGGYGLDGLWNDDFHHTAKVALTGKTGAYYSDYRGSPQEFISALKYGYLYQGQRYAWQKKGRGTPTFGVPPAAFAVFLQNHDQVANSGRGLRGHQLTSPGRWRALTALTLLAPGTPILFQGQEFASSSPFLFFVDHNPELARLVRQGRGDFLAQFPSLAAPEARAIFADPGDEKTFRACKLDFSERQRHPDTYALHEDLLRLRREDPVFAAQRPGGLDGAVLGDGAFVLRFFGTDGDDRLLLVNLGKDLHLEVVPEPLLAPQEGHTWSLLWSSDSPRYGAGATVPIETAEGWRLPGEAAVVLHPVASSTNTANKEEEQGDASKGTNDG
jgi:maltooligosyltrehalose trehalohydrolase